MPVEFILSRTSGGRDALVFNQIKQLIQTDPLTPVLVLVPPQSTLSTEQQLMARLEVRGLMGVSVQSPQKVCSAVLDQVYGRGLVCVDSAGKSMLIKRALRDMPLKTLAKTAQKAQTPMQLAELFSEFKTLDITPQMLAEYRTGRSLTDAKLSEISRLYASYVQEMQGRLDHEDQINLVIEHIPEARFIREAHLFVLGFDIYNAQTVRFIQALMHTARSTVMTFLWAPPGSVDAAVYAICDENRAKFTADAQKLGLTVTEVDEPQGEADLLHLERCLFAHADCARIPAQHLYTISAPTQSDEVRAVAAQIVKLHETQGVALRDMVIVCGNMLAYQADIRRIFMQAGIPVFLGEKRSLAQCGVAQSVLTALELSQGRLRKDTLIAHVLCGLCGLDTRQASVLQRYVFENIRDGFAFLKPFADEDAEQARARLMSPLLTLRARVKKATTARELLDGLFSYLQEIHWEDAVQSLAAQAEAQSLAEESAFLLQAKDRTLALLRQAAEIFGDRIIPRFELVNLLRAGMEAASLRVIPPAAEEVVAGEIAYTRPAQLKVLFVIGANEGILPNYAQNDDFLSNYEREQILKDLCGLTLTGTVEKQKLAIVKALAKPSHRIYFSYVEDGERVISPIVERIHALFEGVRHLEGRTLAYELRAGAVFCAAHDLRNALACGELEDAELVQAALQDETARRVMGYALQPPAAKPLAPGALYGKVYGSASRMEQYYSCPFRQFVRYGLKAQPLREYTINALDAGNFAHRILELCSIKMSEIGWDTLQAEQISGIVEACALEIKRETPKYMLNKHNETVLLAVQREAELAAQVMFRQVQSGLLRPQHFEYGFKLELNGCTLSGVIDRIDTAMLDGEPYFSIVDYKTGDQDFDLSMLAGGLHLQLAVYMMAAMELTGAQFGGAGYFAIHLPQLSQESTDVDADFRMRGLALADGEALKALYGTAGSDLFSFRIHFKKDGTPDAHAQKRCYTQEEIGVIIAYARRLMEQAAHKMQQGDTRILPARAGNERPCTYCDYASICMIQAESSTREIPKAEKDELLRGMRQACKEDDPS